MTTSIGCVPMENEMNNKLAYAAVIATTAVAFGIIDPADVRAEGSFYRMALSQAATDAAIKGKVEAALATERTLAATHIYVDVKGAVILLSGDASNAGQRVTAGRLAAGVEGVKKVMNEIMVPRSG